MCSYPVVGGTTYECVKAQFEWEIPSFFLVGAFTDKSWDSPPFYFLDAEWCLRINLIVDGDNEYWKGLYLVVRNPSSCYSVTFTLGIRHLREPCQFGPETRVFHKTNTFHGSIKLFRRLYLKRINVQDHSLVIYCDASQSKPSPAIACQTTLLNSATTLCLNFQDLLLSGRKSDLKIIVRGQEFKTHKLILETRSPVFAAMFEHDMTEKKESVVKVEDCDPDTFQNFLQCVYAGRVEDLSVDKAIRLYMVSHKYTVTDIMEKCVQLLGEELSEGTVCDILALATRYNEANLRKTAEEFLIRNINDVVSTSNWSSLMAESPLLQKYS